MIRLTRTNSYITAYSTGTCLTGTQVHIEMTLERKTSSLVLRSSWSVGSDFIRH